ncbi:MAG: hypothetical protein WC214_05705 [Candidatus Omnitrophota bacterium]|jgi:hypothetical protein
MHGIELKGGVNDCYYNIEGKCVNKAITRRKTNMRCDWDSKINCSHTQLGVDYCSEYLRQEFAENPELRRKTKRYRKAIFGDV